MKFLAAFTLLVAAGVTAQDMNCEAEYIVSRCLKTETDKVTACDQTDFNCLCAAYQAVATCYNNCPNDTRGPSAVANVTAYCRNVTTTAASSRATAAPTASSSIATKLDGAPPTSAAGFVSGSATPTSGSSAASVVGRAAGGASVVIVAGIVGVLSWL
ncbi:hypothetical protein CCM_02030 [Cordyceps militaris CM01]|uniref:GPI anchored serine-threonine rich n=1 Tax=Cordyceps militaris (strain CM01) TaxID=983644 RepID=G3JC96_CORMM|nr:uncharacterized protein CCM_02030 [Cordyceps militaris CM01]EGX93761.1 hypothetical protein CCM_02030 [Cordyceps militaris CM01]